MGNHGPADPVAADHLWAAVSRFPKGCTAKMIAAKLNWKAEHASSRLGRLAMYGLLDRVPNPEGRRREYRYQVKQWSAHV